MKLNALTLKKTVTLEKTNWRKKCKGRGKQNMLA